MDKKQLIQNIMWLLDDLDKGICSHNDAIAGIRRQLSDYDESQEPKGNPYYSKSTKELHSRVIKENLERTKRINEHQVSSIVGSIQYIEPKEQSGWIDVKDGLPEKGETVLVKDSGYGYSTDHINIYSGKWDWFENVTDWHKLPEYKKQ